MSSASTRMLQTEIDCEKLMQATRDRMIHGIKPPKPEKPNQPYAKFLQQPEPEPNIPKVWPRIERTNTEILRDRVWWEYRKMQKYRICSRCGIYNKYHILTNSFPVAKEQGPNFYIVTHKLETEEIVRKDSLDQDDLGNLCKRCVKHVLGYEAFPLGPTREEMEIKVTDLKQVERIRQIGQDTEIRRIKQEQTEAKQKAEKEARQRREAEEKKELEKAKKAIRKSKEEEAEAKKK